MHVLADRRQDVHVENCLPHLSRGTGIGHGHFHDCVTAVSLAIRNPGNEELSIGAIKLMQTISRRLAESDPQVSVLLAKLSVRARCSCRDGTCLSPCYGCTNWHDNCICCHLLL